MRIIVAVLMLAPGVVLAASPFDGTWKARVGSMKVIGKPDVFALADGVFTCATCKPSYRVKADGVDHKVIGHDYYDTVAVTVLDAHSLRVVYKRDGKLTGEGAITVSADGATLSGRYTDYNGAEPASGTYTETRVAAAPPGAHAASGSWQQSSMGGANDAITTVTYAMSDDHFSWSANGQSYDAKFDGRQYPINGDPGHTQVTVRRIDANTVEETDSRAGTVTDEIRLTVAQDGRTLESSDHSVLHGQTLTVTYDKQ